MGIPNESPSINGLLVTSDTKLSSGSVFKRARTSVEIKVPRTSVSAASKQMRSQPISKLSQGAEEEANTSSAVPKPAAKFKRPFMELSSSPEVTEGPKSKKLASAASPPSKRATASSGSKSVTTVEKKKTLGPDAKKPLATGIKKGLGSAASSAPKSKAPDSIDDSDTILALALSKMDHKVIKYLIQQASKGDSEAAKAVKSVFIVAGHEVQQWHQGDDQERYDDDGKQKALVKKTEQPVKEAHSGKYEHRYAICDRCKRTFDKGKNPVGACSWHSGELEVSEAFREEWDDGYGYRQFMNKGYDVDDDYSAFEDAEEDAEKEWDCCLKPEKNPGCMVSRHRDKSLAAGTLKRKH